MLLTIFLPCVCSPGLFSNYLKVKISVPQNHKPSGLTAQGSFACFTVTRWTLPQFCWISQHNPHGFFKSIYTAGVIHKYSTSNTGSSFQFLPNCQHFSLRCNYFSKIRIFRRKYKGHRIGLNSLPFKRKYHQLLQMHCQRKKHLFT